MNDIQHKIGTAFMDDFGALCLEAVNGGYDLDSLYDGGRAWGDFSKVILAVAVLRGVKSYDDYLLMFMAINPIDHKPASRQLFARFTGISTVKPSSQIEYNRTYRHKTKQQLDELRELTALKWIDENIDRARSYIGEHPKQ